MVSRFQAASLVASPSYPNAVAWSDENLVAVASGHLVTILDPDKPFGPRGLITIPSSKPFPTGLIDRKDLLSDDLLPICLSRDLRPCVRSISWSPIGLAPNSGCLLSVCTTEGRVMIYHMPFCEFSAEWVQVMDISEKLSTHLLNQNFGFGEPDIIRVESQDESANQGCIEKENVDDLPISVSREKRKRSKKNVAETQRNLLQSFSMKKCNAKPLKKVTENCSHPLISVEQYASRSAMLSSLVVAWSPMLWLPSETGQVPTNTSPNGRSILAVGGKSGKISFWKINKPQCYSIHRSNEPTAAFLIGFLQAHGTWITTISWALSNFDAPNSQLLLATGSSNGSVKIWGGCIEELLKSSEVSNVPFHLLKEVISVDYVPVSALSLVVHAQSPPQIHLAVGKGSGTFEVWISDISTGKFEKAGPYDAHDHVVTGLAWAFGGSCLYTCCQDDSIRSWIFSGNSLCEVPFPSNILGVQNSTDVPNVFDSCFGLAVSPGSLMVAVAHSYDPDLLNPMYQARTQKAAVEFFWIGGQQLYTTFDRYPDFDAEAFPGFPAKELTYWEHNVLWSLKQFDDMDKPLVVWDITAGLRAFKQCSPTYVEHILLKWLGSYMDLEFGLPDTIISHSSTYFSNISSRMLHLLNIIIRRVLFGPQVAEEITSKQMDVRGLFSAEEEEPQLWKELLLCSERELRERLVGFSFSVILNHLSHSGYWCPVGLRQMEQWVTLNHDIVKDHLKFLRSEIGKLDKSRLDSIVGYVAEERCCYCSTSVPFESAEVAVCHGEKCPDGVVVQRHTVARCAVSMHLCPATPSWFCICCRRRASVLGPWPLFTMPRFPSDFPSIANFSSVGKPLCVFCGILLQRLQPDFLLSPSPV